MSIAKRIRHEKSKGKRKIPKKGRIYQLLKALPQGYKRETTRHLRLVKMVAEEVGKQLKLKGINVDRGLLSRMALTHDAMRDRPGHDRAVQTHFRDAGFPSFARSIGRVISAKPDRLKYYSLEERILIYCDEVSRWNCKLGQESRHTVVPLEKAILNLKARYSEDPKMLEFVETEGQAIRQIEKELVIMGLDRGAIQGMWI